MVFKYFRKKCWYCTRAKEKGDRHCKNCGRKL